MIASLTRGRAGHYRSHVGAESVPMSLRQGLPGARTPEPRRVHRCAVFLWSGGGLPLRLAAWQGSRLLASVLGGVLRPATRSVRQVLLRPVFETGLLGAQ